MSLGEVRFAGESFERTAVRWIRLAGPGLEGDVGTAPIQSDVLIRRDGTFRQGDLQGC